MKEKLHIELTVPKYWTGKQAQAVSEFLESIMTAIWEVHGDEIDEATEAEEREWLIAAGGELPKKNDDYPF